MKIDGGTISDQEAPYVIAEIGASHQGNLDIAIALIAYAANAGADAVKLQCYTPDTITIDCDNDDFIIKGGPWKGRKLYELYGHAHTPWAWFPALFAAAKDYGITIFSSVFDKTSVDFLEKLGCPAYKIASMEIVDIPLIEYAAKTGKPLIISTGMALDKEIFEASGLCNEDLLALLHCVSGYPTEIRNTNLGKLITLKNEYQCQVGISDHSPGWEVPVAAAALGATIIEKHIKLYGDNSSEDSGFAIDPDEFEGMCSAVKNIWMAINMSYGERGEGSSRQLRRSLYVVEDMRAGEVFTEGNVRSIRPAYGLPPKELPKVLGYEAAHDIKRGTALSWDLILSS